MKNPIVLLLGALIVVLIIIQVADHPVRVYTTPSSNINYTKNGNGNITACPDDAKQCPDGSYVGRTGPQCQFADCPNAPQPPVQMGTLSGHMTIGPICPVQRTPPDPNCLPNAATYAARPIYIYTPDHQTLLRTITANVSGNFNIDLAPGSYLIDMDHPRVGSVSGVPAVINIQSGQVTTINNINVDTGIR